MPCTPQTPTPCYRYVELPFAHQDAWGDRIEEVHALHEQPVDGGRIEEVHEEGDDLTEEEDLVGGRYEQVAQVRTGHGQREVKVNQMPLVVKNSAKES